MKLPKAFTKAVISGSQIYFKRDMTDEELVELMEFKRLYKIPVIRKLTLKRLYSQGLYQGQIYKMYKKHDIINDLPFKPSRE